MKPYYSEDGIDLHLGDCRDVLKSLPDESVQTCVTSPPYFGLRDYGTDGQIGLEQTPDAYVAEMISVFGEVRRVLKDDGTLWLNIGDSYAGSGKGGNPENSPFKMQRSNAGSLTQIGTQAHGRDKTFGLKQKDLIGIPWRVAFALQADGWYLRSEIIWAKPNGMPSSQLDRCTSSHESIFLLSKNLRYFSDFDAIKTPPRESTLIRNAQDVQSQAGSHRGNGGRKTNGAMKAVGGDKQRGHPRVHAGFNDRWDHMVKAEQQSMPVMMRDVWFVATGGFHEAHSAVMPEEIARRCILAGSRPGHTVLDPFNGSGTTAKMARLLGNKYVGIELSPSYCDLTVNRLRQGVLFCAGTVIE